MQAHFQKYYDTVMPYLKTILVGANDKQNRMLRAKSMECISLVGMAVGKDKFRVDAKQVMNLNFSQHRFSPLILLNKPQAQLHHLVHFVRPFHSAIMPGGFLYKGQSEVLLSFAHVFILQYIERKQDRSLNTSLHVCFDQVMEVLMTLQGVQMEDDDPTISYMLQVCSSNQLAVT